MKYVYIDESGDTGRRSKYIVLVALTTPEPRKIEKAMKKIWRVKPALHSHGELHAYTSDDATRKRVLLTIANLDIRAKYIIIDKSKQNEALDNLYYSGLADLIRLHNDAQSIVIDKKDTNKKRQTIIDSLNLNKIFEKVVFEQSHNASQLQAVDFIAWSIGRSLEQGDQVFFDMIKGNLDE